MRGEWDEAKQHDVLFLLSVRPPDAGQLAEMRARADPPGVMELYGLVTVRGCEVIEVKDEGEYKTLLPALAVRFCHRVRLRGHRGQGTRVQFCKI